MTTHGSATPYHTTPDGWMTFCGITWQVLNHIIATEGQCAWSANAALVNCERCRKAMLPRSLQPADVDRWLG